MEAWIITVGKSTCGRGATERCRRAKSPANATPIVRSVVATGRRMKISLKCILRLQKSLRSADYADSVGNFDTSREDQNAHPANAGSFALSYRATANRNLRNLRIFLSFGIAG